jgi:hypothetical protein
MVWNYLLHLFFSLYFLFFFVFLFCFFVCSLPRFAHFTIHFFLPLLCFIGFSFAFTFHFLFSLLTNLLFLIFFYFIFYFLFFLDYQMNLLITNGINDANLKLSNQLSQLYVVHKTVELWKQNEQKTTLLEQNANAHTKQSAPKNNYVCFPFPL